MAQRLAIVATVLAMMLIPVGHADAAWPSRGTPGSGGGTYNPAADLAWSGTGMYVAWAAGTDYAEVSQWNGTGWTAMPALGTGAGRHTVPSIAWHAGQLWGAFNDGSDEPRVKYYDGTGWVLVTDPTVPNANSVRAEPTITSDGTLLWLAWQDGNRVLHVASWNGSAWTELAASPGSSTANMYASLHYNTTTATLWIAYNDANRAVVKEYTGGAWQLRGSLDAAGVNAVPAITDVGGTPFVSWNHWDAQHTSRISYLVAGVWRPADSHNLLGSGTNHSYPDILWNGTSLWGVHTDSDAAMTVQALERDASPLQASVHGQYRADGTTQIPPGQWTTDGITTNVVLKFDVGTITASQTVTPWIEIQPIGTSFSATCGSSVAGATFSGADVTISGAGQVAQAAVNVTGLTDGTEYHWRACSVDTGDATPSPWYGDDSVAWFGVSSSPRWRLVPDVARAANGVWGVDVGTSACGYSTTSSDEPAAMDEDIDYPDDSACTSGASSANFARTIDNPAIGADEYELTDAPADLQSISDITVRSRLRKVGGKTGSVTVRVHLSDGTLLGTPVTHATTTSWANYSYTITGLSLTKTQADGLYVELHQEVGGGGANTQVQASTVNLDLAYVEAPANSPPATPTLSSHADGVTVATSTPVFGAVFSDPDAGDTGTLHFEVCNVATAAGQSCVAAGGVVGASGSSPAGIDLDSAGSWTPAPLAPGTWYWHAYSADAGGALSSWAATRQVVVDSTLREAPLVPESTFASNSGWKTTFHDSAGCLEGGPFPIAVNELIEETNDSSSCSSWTDVTSMVFTASDPAGPDVSWELTNAPGTMGATSSLEVIVRARKTADRTGTITAQLRDSAGTAVGAPLTSAVGTTFRDYRFVFAAASLAAADVDGLRVQLTGSVAGAGAATALQASTVNVRLAYTPVSEGRATLLPNAAAGGSSTWDRYDSGCFAIGAPEPTAVDEDIDAPVDTACGGAVWEQFLRTTGNATAQTLQLDLQDAPADLTTLTDVVVRYRMRKAFALDGTGATITLRRSDGTVIGSSVGARVESSFVTVSFPVRGLSLGPTDVNGMYVTIATSPDGASSADLHVSTLNLDIVYSTAAASSATIGVDSATQALGSLVAGSDGTGSTTVTVTTTNATGYTLSATDEHDTWAADCTCADQVADWTGTAATPTAWAAGTAGYMGLTVRDATGGRLAKWGTGTGTAEGDFTSNLYAGLDLAASGTLHTTTASTAGDTIVVTYRANPGAAQKPGDYDATVTYTATANP